MTTKEYLSQIKKLERMIQNKLIECSQLRVIASSVTISNDNERVKTSPEKDKIGAVVSKIVDIENEVDRMIDKRCSIVDQIDDINDTDMYDILAKVYILGRDLKVIAIERGVTYRHISRLYKSAITEFERKYGSEYLS